MACLASPALRSAPRMAPAPRAQGRQAPHSPLRVAASAATPSNLAAKYKYQGPTSSRRGNGGAVPEPKVEEAVTSGEGAQPSVKPENVKRVTSAEEFQRELLATDGLVVAEFTRESLPNTERTQQTLLSLTNTTPDVVFLRIMADQTEELRELCVGQGVKQIPSYLFFRNGHKVHQETGLNADRLREEVLYYGAAEYPVHQLETVEALQQLLKANEDKLVVVQVTLNFCGPCVRVYPAVLQMSHKMAGSVAFARLFGESNDGTRKLLSELGIVEVPTFLFYQGGELLGRYVGSGKGELVGEVLRYQGVQCT